MSDETKDALEELKAVAKPHRFAADVQRTINSAIAALEKERAEAEPRWAKAVAIADKYRALRAEVQSVEEEMRAISPGPDDLLSTWAERLRRARTGEAGASRT